MELKTKYFHSVHCYNVEHSYESDAEYIKCIRPKELEEILHKFDCILKCGYILPYKDIEALYGKVSRNKYARFNGKDMISISLHADNPEDVDLKYKEDSDGDYEDAYKSFVFQEPSIVLNESVMRLKHIDCPMIYLERLFKEPISLEYMDAVSVNAGSLTPFFEEVDPAKYELFASMRKFRHVDIEFIDNLRGLLKKYGYDVPVVNLNTGSEYHENEEYRKVLEKTR